MPNIVELYKSVRGGGVGRAIFMGLSIYKFVGMKISGFSPVYNE